MTPQITSDINSALVVDFTLNGTSGSQVNLTTENSSETGFAYLGLVQGRDNTSADIGSGSFNYLYLDNTNATAPGSTPQLVGNYSSSHSGGSYASESAVWTIDLNTLTLVPVWINSDSSTPTTVVFTQSNHVYGGGDANAFHTRYPAPVTSATLGLDILVVRLRRARARLRFHARAWRAGPRGARTRQAVPFLALIDEQSSRQSGARVRVRFAARLTTWAAGREEARFQIF